MTYHAFHPTGHHYLTGNKWLTRTSHPNQRIIYHNLYHTYHNGIFRCAKMMFLGTMGARNIYQPSSHSVANTTPPSE